MPTAAGIATGCRAIIAACLRGVLGTRGTFSVTPLILSFGLLTMPVAIATETAAVGVADVATYDRLLETTPADRRCRCRTALPRRGRSSPAGFLAGT
jgi:hypothetical protein